MAEVYTRYDWQEINVTGSVGRGGVNAKNDVMVVQAMLKYALEDRAQFKNVPFPAPSGTIEEDTIQLIYKYQRHLRSRLRVRVSVDGRIDPARGERAFGSKGQWTIQSLNGDAMEAWLVFKGGGDNYIEAICRKYPQVLNALGGSIPVGGLSMSLEPSVPMVGSLNLGLE